jgi:hypothetical protein
MNLRLELNDWTVYIAQMVRALHRNHRLHAGFIPARGPIAIAPG